MTDIEQTELTVVASFEGLLEGELYYSALHDSVWRLRIKDPDFENLSESERAIDYRFYVVKDDVNAEYAVYSNYRPDGDYKPDPHGPAVGEVRNLEKLEQLIESGHLYHVDTDLPVFEAVDELKGHDV